MRLRYLVDAFAVLIAIAGFAVSYTTQADLASKHGFPGWEAWLWPGIADAAALAMILRLHLGQVRPGGYTFEAWLVFALAAVVMIGANSAADRNDPLGGAMHAVVPIVSMAVWHVIVHGKPVRQVPERAGRPADAASATGERPDSLAGRGRRGSQARSAERATGRRPASEVLELVRTARDHLAGELGRKPSDEEIAARMTADGHPLAASRVRFYLPKLRPEERSQPVTADPAKEEVVAWHAR